MPCRQLQRGNSPKLHDQVNQEMNDLVSPSSQPFLQDPTLVRNLDRMAEVSAGPVYNSLTEPVSPSSSENSIVVEDGTVKVKRKLGLVSGTALIVGTMIGSGIFISPKGVLAGTGSVALSLIVWVSCGIISLFGLSTITRGGTGCGLHLCPSLAL